MAYFCSSARMRGMPARLPYWPWLRRPIDSPPSRSSPVSWSESNEIATAQRAPSGHTSGRSVLPARTRSTMPRQRASDHCQGCSGSSGLGTMVGRADMVSS
jgi:hypothetical protein